MSTEYENYEVDEDDAAFQMELDESPFTIKYQQAYQLYLMDKNVEAEKILRSLISDDTEFYSVFCLLAKVLSDLAKHEEATDTARKAVTLAPDDAEGYASLAYVYYNNDQDKSALKAINKAIELEPDDSHHHFYKAVCLNALRRNNEAIDALKSSLKIDPQNHNALSLLATIESQMGITDAEDSARSALRLAPQSALAHYAKGHTHLNNGECEQASAAFSEALRLDPNFDPAREGALDALRTTNFMYRQIYKFSLFCNRLGSKSTWIMIIGLIIGLRIMRAIAKTYPALAPVAITLTLLYTGFALYSHIAEPISNFILLFNRFGRQALLLREKISGVLLALFAGIGGGLLATFWGAIIDKTPGLSPTSEFMCKVSIVLLALAIPLSSTLANEVLFQSKKCAGLCIVIAVIMLSMLALSYPVSTFSTVGIFSVVSFAWLSFYQNTRCYSE